ncbi:MAG: diacylglycerol kinase family protein [Desulfuromonadaceae bacterium]|nr:diacylglycerol kinase family protein [Desulfuromonadaceae bacterium]
MKTYLFVNPASGHYSAKNWQFVLENLHESGTSPVIFQVRTPTEISAYCRTINKAQGAPLVIVAGGDGTINAVTNGLKPGTATLAVLPFGTSNVLAAEIGITSIDNALERIKGKKTQSLSVGVIELEGHCHRFLLMAGIGLDGAVVRDVWPFGKRFLRQGAYVLSALKNAMAWDTTLFNIDTSERNITCHTAIICNASRYGGNFVLSPDSSLFSSGLSAVCITENTRRTYLNSALDLFRGMAEANRDMIRLHSSVFEVSGNHPIQIDGDFIGYGPARISTCADFARIIV